jgi:hypothetical protein
MGMYGYLAAISAETVRFLGREPDFDTFMGLLTGENGLELGQMWDAVDRVVSSLLEGRISISSGTPVTDDLGSARPGSSRRTTCDRWPPH